MSIYLVRRMENFVADVPIAEAVGRRRRVDPAKLKALTETMPEQKESAGSFVRRMRDDSRY